MEEEVCPKCDIGEMCFNDEGIEVCDNCGYIDPEDLENQNESSIGDGFDMLSDGDSDGLTALDESLMLH